MFCVLSGGVGGATVAQGAARSAAPLGPPVPPPPMPMAATHSPVPIATPRPAWQPPGELAGPVANLAGGATIVARNMVGHPVLGPVRGQVILRRSGKPDLRLLAREGVVVDQLVAEDLDGKGRRQLVVVWVSTGSGHYITPEIYDIGADGTLKLRWAPASGVTLAEGVVTPLKGKGFVTREALLIHSFKRPYLHRTILYGPRAGKFVALTTSVETPHGPDQTVNAAGDLFEREHWAGALKLYLNASGGLSKGGEPDLASDALLQAARCALKLGHKPQARHLLEQLVRDYPKQTASREAQAALGRLRAPKEDADR